MQVLSFNIGHSIIKNQHKLQNKNRKSANNYTGNIIVRHLVPSPGHSHALFHWYIRKKINVCNIENVGVAWGRGYLPSMLTEPLSLQM